jgi:hypothetical protein
MDENNMTTEVVESEVTEVAENEKNDNGGSGVEHPVLTLMAVGAVAGLAAGVAAKGTEKVLDAAGQGIYNAKRKLADWNDDRKAKAEEKKAERERRYQEKKAEKEAKNNK